MKFKGNDVYAGRREALVQIPGISKDELVWAPDGDHFRFLRLLLGGIGNDDAAPHSFLLFYPLYHNAVV